jgi:TolA-binding protein
MISRYLIFYEKEKTYLQELDLRRRAGLCSGNKFLWPSLLLGLLTSCSNHSSAQLSKELQTVTSWAATANMVDHTWIQGAVPTVYAKQTLQTAQQELQKEISTLREPQSFTATKQNRVALLEHLHRLQQILEQMSTTVDQGNSTAMPQQLRQLSMEAQKIDMLAKAIGGRREKNP